MTPIKFALSIWLLFAFAAPASYAQAMQFDSVSYTSDSFCLAGRICLTMGVPGTVVKICVGASAPCSTMATTYTNASALQPCPNGTQVERAGESGTECVASSDSAGHFEAWLRPGIYSYYLAIPESAGGTTFGPYPFSVHQDVPEYTSDANYSTFPSACAAAGSAPLEVSRAWTGLATASYPCNIIFLTGGTLQPAHGQTVTMTGSITAPLIRIFDLSEGGTIIPLGVPELYPQWFGAKGDRSTDDSAAIQNAEMVAASVARPLHFTAATYEVCSAAVTTANAVVNFGDGPGISLLERHSSCLQARSNMLNITAPGAVELRDFGVDMLADGSTFSNDAIVVTGASGVKLRNLYVAHAQVVGFQCIDCSNVSDSGSSYYQNWWFGKSISCSKGGTSDPVFNYRFSDANVHYEDQPVGLGYNFFCSDISVIDDTFHKSNLSFVQMPNANGLVSGVQIDGVPTYGCITTGQCGGNGTYDALFMEGVSNLTINGGSVANFRGQQGAVFCGGSQLQIPQTGALMQLPCSHVTVNGTKVDNSTGYSVYINGQSFDGSIPGTRNSIKGTIVTNTAQCPVVVATIFAEIAGNRCDTTTNGGYSFGKVAHAVFRNNLGHNIGTAAPGNYVGLLINDPATRDVTVDGNIFIEDSGNLLLRCFDDETLATGHESAVQHANNSCQGGAVDWYPTSAGAK